VVNILEERKEERGQAVKFRRRKEGKGERGRRRRWCRPCGKRSGALWGGLNGGKRRRNEKGELMDILPSAGRVVLEL
jgi:hypothetical protein